MGKVSDTPIAALEGRAEYVAERLSMLANAKRLLILCELAKGEMSVGALQDRVGLSQSALSQHLALVVFRESALQRRNDLGLARSGRGREPYGILRRNSRHLCRVQDLGRFRHAASSLVADGASKRCPASTGLLCRGLPVAKVLPVSISSVP